MFHLHLIAKEIVADLVNSAVEKCEPFCFVARILDEVILKVDNCSLNECLVDETYVKGDDTRYHFDNTWLQLYPWLLKDKSLSEASGKEYFFCSDCRMFPNLAHGGSCSQWVSGWCGGSDGYRHESLRLHNNSATHKLLAQKASKINANAEPCGSAESALKDPYLVIKISNEKVLEWRKSMPKEKS